MKRVVLAWSVLAALAFPLTGVVGASGGGGQAWIDSPLGSAVVSDVPVPVIAHVADSSGVAAVEVRVDGQLVADLAGSGETLQVIEMEWVPEGSGIFLISVAGRGNAGAWGQPAEVVVTVDLGLVDRTTTTSSTPEGSVTTTTRPASTTTTRPSSTTTQSTTTTSRPTTTTTSTTACGLGTPSPTGPTGSVSFNVVTLTWSYSGCREPEEFDLQLSREPGFARIDQTGAAAGDQRSWASPALECATWYWRIRTYDAGSYGSWSSSGSFVVSLRGC